MVKSPYYNVSQQKKKIARKELVRRTAISKQVNRLIISTDYAHIQHNLSILKLSFSSYGMGSYIHAGVNKMSARGHVQFLLLWPLFALGRLR